MRSKACLTLMEQMVMVLVFALAAALCLGLFARADRLDADTARREQGALLAQNAVELLKSGGDPADLTLPEGCSLAVERPDSGQPGLAMGVVRVLWEGTEVFSLTAGWQEVAP